VEEAWQGDECSFWVEGKCDRRACLARTCASNGASRCRWAATVSLSMTGWRTWGERESADDPVYINLGFPSWMRAANYWSNRTRWGGAGCRGRTGLGEWMRFQKPTAGYAEQVFYHDLPANKDGWASIQLVNQSRKLGLRVGSPESAPAKPGVEWKMMGGAPMYWRSNRPTAGRAGAARSGRAVRCNPCNPASSENSR